MLNTVLSTLSLSLIVTSTALGAALVDPLLININQKTRVIALLKNDSQGFSSPQRYNYKSVYSFLINRTKSSWILLQQEAQRAGVSNRDLHFKNIHWINNSVSVDVSPLGLKALAQLSIVEKIYANRAPTYMRAKLTHEGRPRGGTDMTYGLKDIGLDLVLAARPDINGQGVVLGHLDTGVDGKHPALAGKIKLFYVGSTGKLGDPTDEGAHGTHTAGTMVGGDRNNNIFGVAPEAKLISAGALGSYDEMLKAMEFMLNPDGNPDTNDAPKSINNSWNCQAAPDVELFYRAISAWEAAGILPIFSAGNYGPQSATITRPHEHPGVIAVGATDAKGKIASFSSRGPSTYRGKPSFKPDLTAPGVDVLSSLPGGKMATMSGTSMATPHVSGITALFYQIKPDLTPIQVREIFTRSLMLVDENGNPTQTQKWNPNFGLGRVNVYQALKLITNMGTVLNRNILASLNPLNVLKSTFSATENFEIPSPLPKDTFDLTQKYETDRNLWIDGAHL